jgi:hypothetical protein
MPLEFKQFFNFNKTNKRLILLATMLALTFSQAGHIQSMFQGFFENLNLF